MPELTISVSDAACERCRLVGRRVVHGVSWCPRFPAVALIDSNSTREQDGRSFTGSVMVSRPVVVGDVVLLVDEYSDNDSPDAFAIWGRVVEVKGRWLRAEHVGDKWSYLDA